MRISLFIMVAWLVGCGASVSPYARVAAGRIGCPAEWIELSQLEGDGGTPQSWVARCGHRAFACSSNVHPEHPRAQVVCSRIGGRPRLSLR